MKPLATTRETHGTDEMGTVDRSLTGRRIAFVHRGSEFGGAEESLLRNAREFREHGAEISVLSFGSAAVTSRFSEAGLRVLVPGKQGMLAATRLGRRIETSAKCRVKGYNHRCAAWISAFLHRRETRAVISAVRKERIELLYCNMGAANDWEFIRAATMVGVKTVSHQRREPPVFASARVLREMNAQCSAFISNSKWTKERWVAKGLRANGHDVIYNAIERLVRQTGANLRERLDLPRDARIILSVGRLTSEKCFDWGLKAFATIAAEFPGWHYVVIGTGDERERLAALAGESGVGERIHLAGEIRGAASYMLDTDLLLHPSPDEPFGRVVAEAMRARRIVIGHASGGVREMIPDGRYGYVFSRPEELAGVLREAFSNCHNEEVRDRAAELIENMCGMASAKRLTQLIRALLNGVQ